MASTSINSFFVDSKPSPADFENFLPWACHQLTLTLRPVIIKHQQATYISSVNTERSRGKGKKKGTSTTYTGQTPRDHSASDDKSDSLDLDSGVKDDQVVFIHTFHDNNNSLVQLKLLKNVTLTREIIKVIGLTVPFQKQLTSITIDRACNQAIIYEISKFLPNSYITEICLDGTFIEQANYYILLEGPNCLKHLSLSKCKINNKAVEKIAAKLTISSEGSGAANTLIILNLASNQITDLGAKYIAEALRTNRKLSYLNISDNNITDIGAAYILDCLKEFALTADELMESRKRHMLYLKKRNELISKALENVRADVDKKEIASKKRSIKLLPKKKLEGTQSFKSTYDVWLEKAETTVDQVLGYYNDPFSANETTVIQDTVYCLGNNILSYLNIAYNNLTYISVKKLLNVLHAQKHLHRKPIGLLNVKIDGNYLPEFCREYAEIDDILDAGTTRKFSTMKKRISTKDSKESK